MWIKFSDTTIRALILRIQNWKLKLTMMILAHNNKRLKKIKLKFIFRYADYELNVYKLNKS